MANKYFIAELVLVNPSHIFKNGKMLRYIRHFEDKMTPEQTLAFLNQNYSVKGRVLTNLLLPLKRFISLMPPKHGDSVKWEMTCSTNHFKDLLQVHDCQAGFVYDNEKNSWIGILPDGNLIENA